MNFTYMSVVVKTLKKRIYIYIYTKTNKKKQKQKAKKYHWYLGYLRVCLSFFLLLLYIFKLVFRIKSNGIWKKDILENQIGMFRLESTEYK